MIGIDDLDFDVVAAAIEILGGHPRGLDRAHAVGVLENARNIVEDADPYHAVGNLRTRAAGRDAAKRRRQAVPEGLHVSSPEFFGCTC
jgi:hypothetical protein